MEEGLVEPQQQPSETTATTGAATAKEEEEETAIMNEQVFSVGSRQETESTGRSLGESIEALTATVAAATTVTTLANSAISAILEIISSSPAASLIESSTSATASTSATLSSAAPPPPPAAAAGVNITITQEDFSTAAIQMWSNIFSWLFGLLTQLIVFLPFRLVSYTVTVTFSSWTLFSIAILLITLGYVIFRYRILTRYSRLPAPPKVSNMGAPFDLRPEIVDEGRDGPQSYQDELMGAFLSSIKVFGYLDRPVFHELARHLQTRKLKAGEILFDEHSESRDFFVVVDGAVQIFLKTNNSNSSSNNSSHDEFNDIDSDIEDSDLDLNLGSKQWKGHILLNEVRTGGTVSSLFSILSVFTSGMQKEADANRSRKEEYDSFPMYQAQAPMNGSASNSGHGLNTGGSMAHVVDGGNNANDGGARAASTGEGGNLLSPSPVLESVFPGLRASISSQIAESGGGGGSASMKTPLSNLYASSPSSSSNDEEAENVPPQSSSATAAATSSFGKPPKIKTLQEGEQQGDAEEDAHIGIFTASSTLPEGLEDIDHENVPSGNPAASSSSTTTSASQDPRIRQKHRGQVSSSAAAGGGKSTRVHPDIVARALEDTTLAVIPATAFQKLAEKFPAAAAGIVLVILIRFQRVTFNTLYRYLGLSRELLRIEKRVNDFTGRGLPSDFFFGDWEDGLDNLKRKMGISVAPTGIGGVGAGGIGPLPSNVSLLRGNINTVGGSASAMTGRFPQSTTRLPGRFTDTEDPPSSRQQAAAAARRLMNRPLGFSQKPPSGGGSSSSTSSTSSKNRKPSSSSKLGNYQPIMDYEGDMDDSERESDGNYSKPPIFLSSTSSSTSGPKASESSRGAIFDDINEEDLKLKQCCYDIITKLIGFNPNVLQVPNATTPPSPSASSLTRLSTSTGTGGGIGGSGMHSSPNFDENLSKSSFTRRLSHARRSSIDSTTEDEQTPSLASMNSASSSTNSLCSDPCSVLQIDGYSAGQVIVKEGDRVDGLYFVIHGLVEASMKARTDEMTEGSQFSAPDPYHHRDELDSPATQKSKDLDPDHRAFKKSLFLIREGGLAGYLSALTGHPSFTTLRAKTDSILAFLPKHVLDRYVERCPNMLFTLARNLIENLSPIVFHIDVALEWGHVNAGQILCRQNDKADSIFLVLSGRLRTILEGNTEVPHAPVSATSKLPSEQSTKPKDPSKRRGSISAMDAAPLDAIGADFFNEEKPTIAATHFEILGEHGQGESVGELEVLTGSRRPGTVHAIRDSEVAIMPKTLFEALAYQHPAITIQISRIIAAKTYLRNGLRSSTSPLDGATFKVGVSAPYATSAPKSIDSAANNQNMKTVAILPVNSLVPIAEFADKLKEALALLGASIHVLNTSAVMTRMGKHAFSRFGRLKLMSWLNEVEDRHRLVMYVADGGVNSPWTQRCVRQADCILLVGLGDEDPAIGEYERLLIGMKTTARKELVLLHSERSCYPGSTAQWLKNRVWIHAHHHIQMRLKTTQAAYNNNNQQRKLPAISSLRSRLFVKYYTQTISRHLKKTGAPPNTHTGLRSDFARLGRRLLSKSVGLALGGGGARGISQIGIIRAFEEAGIPIDMVGGTSIGAFVGGLYARENDHVSIFGRAKSFSNRMSSLWRKILDITYPVTSLFTGHEFNRGIWKVFLDTHIEDCWLSYFCITTNITLSRMEAHRFGYMWRYIRASMSLSGYLPPLCDNGHLLLDGGYLNNLPADVMKVFGADCIIAIDVGSTDDTTPINYGDSLSGWWVLINRLNPLAGWIGPDVSKIPQLAEIQSRLAYVSSVKQLEDAQRVEGVIYLKPPVNSYGTLEFNRYQEIFDCGYKYGKEIVEKWEKDGTLRKMGVKTENSDGKRGRAGRRASI